MLIRAVISIAVEIGWKYMRWMLKLHFCMDSYKRCTLRNHRALKQSPGVCYSRIATYLQHMGFEKSEVDSNLYYIVVGDDPLILVLYVDDMLITG